MRILLLCLVLFVNLLFVVGNHEDYRGYRVYNVKLVSEEQQSKFHLLKSDLVDYWKKPSVAHGIVGQAMVPPSHFDWFEESLQKLGVEKDIAVEDVYDFIVENNKSNDARKSKNYQGSGFNFQGYYRYSEILDHINKLKDTYATSATVSFEVVQSGLTEGNRPLVYVKVTNKNNQPTVQKPVVVVEAGIIPREWVTIPSALYVLDKLLNGPGAPLLDRFEWIVIPVANPDGYEYTHTNNLRFWMKNLSTKSHLGQICPGVNINRNFDIDWSISDSSSSPCSHIYAGIKASSEEETKFLNSIAENYGSRIQLYFSLQNTGGFISYPWQYERAASGMFRQHLLLSRDMAAATKAPYQAGVGSVIAGDRASGSSSDFFRDKGVLYTFNIDVIPVGQNGVMVPESEIVNVAEDVWAAVSVAANNIDKY